jgi:5-methylcytosine-specific restriction endonuclease McrA
MAVDHIIPLAVGGSDDISNLCLACYRCNEFKGARLEATDPLSRESVPLFHPSRQVWSDHFAGAEMVCA